MQISSKIPTPSSQNELLMRRSSGSAKIESVCLRIDIRCPIKLLQLLKNMDNLPVEVWLIILSYLSPNDLIWASATCEMFFELSRKNSFFTEKLLHSRLLYNNSRVIFDCHENAFLSFYQKLCFSLEKYVSSEDYFLKGREIIMSKLMFSELPFRF